MTAAGAGTVACHRAHRHPLVRRTSAHGRRQDRPRRHPGGLGRPVQRRRRRRLPPGGVTHTAGWRAQPPLRTRAVHSRPVSTRRPRCGPAAWTMRLLASLLATLLLGLFAAPARAATVPAPAREGVWPLSPRPQVVGGFDPPVDTLGSRSPRGRPARARRPAGARRPGRDGHLRRSAGRARGGRGGPRWRADDVRTGERERDGRRRRRPRVR